MPEAKLEHKTLKVRHLIADLRSGKIVIPEFQRDYVWKKNRAPRLIDSLYRGYPIASLLIWESDETTRARRTEPRPYRSLRMNWLIDGQQRVITLARTLSGDEGIEVLFNPDQDVFQLASGSTTKDPNWVRVSELWDDELYSHIRRGLDGSGSSNRREAKFERVRAILDYEVPQVTMIDHSFENAVQAFERINTLGVKLKKEDIESAHIASRHSGFIADNAVPFLEKLQRQGFKRINIMHLFRACAFIARPDGRDRTPLHELGTCDVLSAWKKTERATEHAIGLIRSELGLVNMDVLWSGSLVVPVIALCATMQTRERDAPAIAAWLALAALWHRYSSSSDTALDQDLRACRESDPIGGLLKNLKQGSGTLLASADDFVGTFVDRSGLLAAYIACVNRGILDFFTGAKVLLQDNIDRHHILPRGQFSDDFKLNADTIANVAFIASDVNKSIGLTGPEVYMKKLSNRMLRSQCVPENQALWTIDNAEEFWQERRTLLAASFNEFIRKSLPQRRLGSSV